MNLAEFRPLIRGLAAGISRYLKLVNLRMAKEEKKPAKQAPKTFHDIMKASVKDNPKPKKTGTQILSEISEAVKKLDRKYPRAFVMDGLETQIRAGFIFSAGIPSLAYTLNPNWPPTIVEDVKTTITKKAVENDVAVITTSL